MLEIREVSCIHDICLHNQLIRFEREFLISEIRNTQDHFTKVLQSVITETNKQPYRRER